MDRIRVFLPWDGDEPTFEAWTDGQTWNGWACPRFEKAEADKVIAHLNAWNPRPWGVARHDADSDTFLVPDENAPGEFDQWAGRVWDGKRLYAIGAWAYTWSAATPVNA